MEVRIGAISGSTGMEPKPTGMVFGQDSATLAEFCSFLRVDLTQGRRYPGMFGGRMAPETGAYLPRRHIVLLRYVRVSS